MVLSALHTIVRMCPLFKLLHMTEQAGHLLELNLIRLPTPHPFGQRL